MFDTTDELLRAVAEAVLERCTDFTDQNSCAYVVGLELDAIIVRCTSEHTPEWHGGGDRLAAARAEGRAEGTRGAYENAAMIAEENPRGYGEFIAVLIRRARAQIKASC